MYQAGNYAEAEEKFRLAAARGCLDAMMNLGDMYEVCMLARTLLRPCGPPWTTFAVLATFVMPHGFLLFFAVFRRVSFARTDRTIRTLF